MARPCRPISLAPETPPARPPHAVEKRVMRFVSWSCPDGHLITSGRSAAVAERDPASGGAPTCKVNNGAAPQTFLDPAIPRRNDRFRAYCTQPAPPTTHLPMVNRSPPLRHSDFPPP